MTLNFNKQIMHIGYPRGFNVNALADQHSINSKMYDLVISKKSNFVYCTNFQSLENGYSVIQLETAVGAAIKNFEGGLGEKSWLYP